MAPHVQIRFCSPAGECGVITAYSCGKDEVIGPLLNFKWGHFTTQRIVRKQLGRKYFSPNSAWAPCRWTLRGFGGGPASKYVWYTRKKSITGINPHASNYAKPLEDKDYRSFSGAIGNARPFETPLIRNAPKTWKGVLNAVSHNPRAR